MFLMYLLGASKMLKKLFFKLLFREQEHTSYNSTTTCGGDT
jgi:hypothetical protein